VRRLVTILRREAAAGVSAALLHLADACCPAGVAIPPSCRPGKSRVTSGWRARRQQGAAGHHHHRRGAARRGNLGLRPGRAPVPPLRHTGPLRGPGPRPRGPDYLLVPELPVL